jgi:CPA2 family monovalent cation:H+ antiporter-2
VSREIKTLHPHGNNLRICFGYQEIEIMWQLLMEIVLLLSVAFILGAAAQKFKQSAIIGYLMAGVVVGPLLFNAEAVKQVAELGVALLLFSIGLEFSFSRLRQLGAVAVVGGTFQVAVSLLFFAMMLLPF